MSSFRYYEQEKNNLQREDVDASADYRATFKKISRPFQKNKKKRKWNKNVTF